MQHKAVKGQGQQADNKGGRRPLLALVVAQFHRVHPGGFLPLQSPFALCSSPFAASLFFCRFSRGFHARHRQAKRRKTARQITGEASSLFMALVVASFHHFRSGQPLPFQCPFPFGFGLLLLVPLSLSLSASFFSPLNRALAYAAQGRERRRTTGR